MTIAAEKARKARISAFTALRTADPERFRLEVELAWAKKELRDLATFDSGSGESAMRTAAVALRTVEQAGADNWYPPHEDEPRDLHRAWNRPYDVLLAEVNSLRALTERLLNRLDQLRCLSHTSAKLAEDAAALLKAVGSAPVPR